MDGLISFSQSLSHSHSHTLIHEGGGASRRLHTGGAGAFGARPPCVDSFMDECVAVAVAEAVAVAVTEAVAEADQSIHDQSIHDPSIRAGRGRGDWQKLPKSACGDGGDDGGGAGSGQTLLSPSRTQE